ncbi:MAG: peptidylprolyl isomerase [Flavobacteriales bacterium]
MKLLNRIAILVAITLMSLNINAQNKNATVLTIAGDNISLEEFENIFRKNNRDSVITQASLDEYMELFINFKMKVKEAMSLGMDTITKFKTELAGYRTTLARPYLTDSDMLNDMMKEAYERLQQEVNASHILIKCEPNASPEDSLRAYNKAMEARKKILAGEPFGQVAKAYSEDPSAKDNGGDLGFFTAFQMVYQFEDAAYATKVGEVSMPVRTRYGYHIIKVNEKRPSRGEIHVAHIMVKEKKEPNGAENAKARATEIYEKAKAGEDFKDLASKYSDDGSTSKTGGELPWFGTNKMVGEFEDAAFALQKDGDVSEPVKTSYGWHIIKRLGYRTMGSFEEVEKDMKSRVSRDGRSEKTRNSFINKLKVDYKYTYNQKVVDAIAAKADTGIFMGKWNLSSKELKQVFFTVDGNKHTVQELYNQLTDRAKIRTKFTPAEYVKDEANHFAELMLLDYEDSKLESKYSAFRLLMNEYREGILLFELTNDKVWKKAVSDSVGLEKYYSEHKDKFMWAQRKDVVFYTCANSAIAKDVRSMINDGMSNSEIAAAINKDTQLNLQIEEGVYTDEDKDILANVPNKTGMSMDIPYNGQVVIAVVKEILPPGPKKFSECRGLVAAEYQTYLENEWIKELRSKYTFKVNKEVLYSIK